MEFLVVSCIFGTKYKKIYNIPVPIPENCIFYFFTNNPKLKTEIIAKGWQYIYVDFELSDDEIVSSLQSKYVKFLKFKNDIDLKNHKLFAQFAKIVYFDHKFKIDAKQMSIIINVMNENKHSSVIIRTTPSLKNTIWDQVNAGNTQYRYRKNMDKTVNLINSKLSHNEISECVRICNTGIMMYNNDENVQPMLDEIYNLCMELEQPECKIFWAMISQKYRHLIKTIQWSDLSPEWCEP